MEKVDLSPAEREALLHIFRSLLSNPLLSEQDKNSLLQEILKITFSELGK